MITRTSIAATAFITAISISSSAQALSVQSQPFTAKTEIIDLGLGALDLLSVSTEQSGVANSPADPDIALAQVAAGVDLGIVDADLDLGVLGVEWLDGDTFELIFDLGASLDTSLIDIPLGLTVAPTIDWTLSDLAFDEEVVDVVQVGGDGILANDGLVFDQTSIGIAFNNLVGAEASLFGAGPQRATFDVVGANDVAPVPLPAGAWLLGSAVGGLMAWRRRTKRT